MMRACLVLGPAADLDDAGANRLRDADLAVFRAVPRAAVFGLDLGVVMGSSEFMRRHPPHRLSPARANYPAGQDPETASAAPSPHSNAPFDTESQSFLSKKVALMQWIVTRRGKNWSGNRKKKVARDACAENERRVLLQLRTLVPDESGAPTMSARL
jgi:hypothetical protein